MDVMISPQIFPIDTNPYMQSPEVIHLCEIGHQANVVPGAGTAERNRPRGQRPRHVRGRRSI